jgi:hypothetical protein
MKIKVYKKAKPEAKPKAVVSPIVQQRMRYMVGDGGSGSHTWLGVVVVVGVILLAIGIAVGAKASHNSAPVESAVVAPVATNPPASSGYDAKRYDQLGGMTMAEWMRQNNTNNALLKSRQAGVRARSMGITQ